MWRWMPWICLLGTLDQGPVARVVAEDPLTNRSLHLAIEGARRRLERPDCQQVLTDFTDGEGRPLISQLQATSRTASAYLAANILFMEHDDAPQCRRDEVVTAFTAPGHKVVHVCGARFARRFRQDSAVAEIIVIHEMLHTLGLGENPPSSSAITAQVTRRCGGS